MTISRRRLLRGAGGVTVMLPFLDAFRSNTAKAQDPDVPPFAIFMRQANGVAAAQSTTELGEEPERFWPTQMGPLTAATVAGRAVDELSPHLERLLMVKGVNGSNFEYGDGHARGAFQGLTARGPTVINAGGDSEAAGESLDHRIGRELNPEGRDSLFLYSGRNSGWLGGACISYRDVGIRRAALHDPALAYQQIMGLSGDQFAELAARQKSVNDLVRDQLTALLGSPKLSSNDQQRLTLHFEAVRDLEAGLMCTLGERQLMTLEGLTGQHDSTDGDEVLAAARVHLDIAALAVACGYTRSVTLQIGNGNDGSTQYRDPDTNQLMENYHYISHRRLSHDSEGAVIPGSDLLHHKIDRQFGQVFKHLLDRLEQFETPNGSKLVDSGVSVWYNDLGNGPAHSPNAMPYIVAGSANGFLKQGEAIEVANTLWVGNHAMMLNTLGSAVGLQKVGGGFLDNFGDPMSGTGLMTELLA